MKSLETFRVRFDQCLNVHIEFFGNLIRSLVIQRTMYLCSSVVFERRVGLWGSLEKVKTLDRVIFLYHKRIDILVVT